MTPVVLVVQHQELCPRAGSAMAGRGAAARCRHPYAGDPLPADLTGHDGLLVLGGQMGANDDDAHPWLGPTKALIRTARTSGCRCSGSASGTSSPPRPSEARSSSTRPAPGAGCSTCPGPRPGAPTPSSSVQAPPCSGITTSSPGCRREQVLARAARRARRRPVRADGMGRAVPRGGGRDRDRWAAKDRALVANEVHDEVGDVDRALAAVTRARAAGPRLATAGHRVRRAGRSSADDVKRGRRQGQRGTPPCNPGAASAPVLVPAAPEAWSFNCGRPLRDTGREVSVP